MSFVYVGIDRLRVYPVSMPPYRISIGVDR
jgi:hypothetical protein